MDNQNNKKILVKDYRFIILGAVIAALFVMVFLGYQKFAPQAGDSDSMQEIAEVSAADNVIPEGHVRRLTDGVVIPEEEQPERIYAVMIENSADAWPLSGLSQARLVYEAPVEGSIPRFMAIFDDQQEIESIGPVRSARPYYVDWAAGMQAMYVHVGGSPEALGLLKNLGIRSLNQFYFGMFFWRSSARYAPHNVYTSIYELGQGFDYKQYELSEIESFKYVEPEEAVQASQVIKIPFSSSGNLYTATWKFDAPNNNYVRWQGGKQQYDLDESEVRASNIVVIQTSVRVIDAMGRRRINTNGEGKAMVFRGGVQLDARWIKENREDDLHFVDDFGNKIAFYPGATWIEVIPLSTDVIIEEEEISGDL